MSDKEIRAPTFVQVHQNPEMLVKLYSEQDITSSHIFDETEEENLTKSWWADEAVKLLLSLVRELKPKIGKTGSLKNKKKMWEIIAGNINKAGYNFSPVQVENKFRGLERTFKRAKSRYNKTGWNRETSAYEKELGEILNDRPAVFAGYIAGSTQDPDLSNKDLIVTSRSSFHIPEEEEAACSTPFVETTDDNSSTMNTSLPLSKNKSTEENILEELRKIREYTNKKVDILQSIEKCNQQKVKLMKERNEILRKLVSAIKKNEYVPLFR